MMSDNFTFIDLFCGIGGFRLGLEAIGGTCVFSCDSNKRCRAIYNQNFNDKPKSFIENVDIDTIPDFDVLTAGFPCQPFTKLGDQSGFKHKRGNMFEYIVEISKEKQPKVLFLENVRALTTMQDGECFRCILDAISNVGYNTYHELMNGSSILPQNRDRVYIVCIRKDIDDNSFQFPKLKELHRCVGDILMDDISEDYEYLIPTENQVQRRLNFRKKFNHTTGFIVDLTFRSPAIVSTYRNERSGKFIPCDLNELGVRYLHYREVARLQGFPEEFVFITYFGKRPDMMYKPLGNSVMPPIIAAIGSRFLEILDVASVDINMILMDMLTNATSPKDASQLKLNVSTFVL